jgi:hypothetical protein
MLLIGNEKEIIQDVKTQLSSKFDMKNIGASGKQETLFKSEEICRDNIAEV